jgi:hypothetical protein
MQLQIQCLTLRDEVFRGRNDSRMRKFKFRRRIIHGLVW